MSARAFWCERAWLGGEGVEPGVLVSIDGELIEAVELGSTEPPPGAERLGGLVVPGLANAHSHAFHRALRGHTQRGRGSFWTWRERMYEVAAALDPDTYRRLARAVFGEMALAGITAVGEFHYLHHGLGGTPYDDPNAMGEALIAAADDAGIRITLLDTCYLHGGIGEEPNETQRRFSDGDAMRWAERVGGLDARGGARVGAAIHSVRAVDPEAMAAVAGWATARDCPLHAHLSEQPAENEACEAAYGVSPAQLLADAGALSPRFTAVHATYLSDADVGLLGSSRCCCCMCPTTERDLADGVGRARDLLDAGGSMSLGSDSHAVIDILEEARAVELDERLATNERGRHGAVELLTAATSAGHESIGWPEAGRIEPGAMADLVSIRLDSVRTAGAGDDIDAAVFAASAADVDTVVCSGEIVVSGGRHQDIDVPAELSGAIAEVLA